MDKAEVKRLKRGMAQHFGLTYDDLHPDKNNSATSTDGIPAYNGAGMEELQKKHADRVQAASAASTPEDAAAKSKLVQDGAAVAVCLSGLLVLWPGESAKTFNEGYVEQFAARMLPHGWDRSIERRAGGFTAACAGSAQAFACTNQSSLMALIGTAVLQYCTNTMDERIFAFFRSIRVTVLFGSRPNEIELLNACENINKANDKVHTELDNIDAVALWIEDMKAHPTHWPTINALSVFKYGAILQDARVPMPTWLRGLLDTLKLPPTVEGQAQAIQDKAITLVWLKTAKATAQHPHLSNYNEISLRARFLLGFGSKALTDLRRVASNLGRLGYANRPFPLSKSVLLSSEILLATALQGKDKDSVPAYRDGAAGEALHVEMVRCFEQRCTWPGYKASKGDAFISGAHWVAFARLWPALWRVMETEWGVQLATWPDPAAQLYAQIWAGEHDATILATSKPMRSHIDTRPHDMANMMRMMFSPLAQVLQNLATAAAMRVSVQPPQEQGATKANAETDAPTAEDQNTEASKASAANDGDVTDELAKGLEAAQKRQMAARLSQEAAKSREESIVDEVLLAAAAVIRTKLIVVRSAEEAKAWMETHTPGFTARTVVVNASMSPDHQTGAKSKRMCTSPSAKRCEDWAAEIKLLPATPILAHVLVRPCQQPSMYNLYLKLEGTHRHHRTIIVPVQLPVNIQAKVKSGGARCGGPSDDRFERGGVEFAVRSTGWRRQDKASAAATPDAAAPSATTAVSAVGVDSDAESDAEMAPGTTADDVAFLAKCDPAMLDSAELKRIFGPAASQLKTAMFQSSSKITRAATFLQDCDQIKVSLGEAAPRVYRKGQVHVDVFLEALNSVLTSSNIPLATTECLVDLTGGTPEAIIAGIILGYQRVIVVAGDTNEYEMYQVPSESDEREHQIHYQQYTSWDPMRPLTGILAAAAIRALRPYVENALFDRRGTWAFRPSVDLNLPPLVTYTYQPLTCTIQKRTHLPDSQHAGDPAPSTEVPAASGASAGDKRAAGNAALKPRAKRLRQPLDVEGELSDGGDDEGAAGMSEGDGEEGEPGDGIADALSQVEELLQEKKKKKPKAKAKATA